MRYAVVIEKAEGNYSAYVPDLPGCVATGASVTEAETLTEREKALHPALLRDLAAELGDDLPWLLVDAARHVGVEAEGASASQLPEAAQQTLRKAATRSLPSARAGTGGRAAM